MGYLKLKFIIRLVVCFGNTGMSIHLLCMGSAWLCDTNLRRIYTNESFSIFSMLHKQMYNQYMFMQSLPYSESRLIEKMNNGKLLYLGSNEICINRPLQKYHILDHNNTMNATYLLLILPFKNICVQSVRSTTISRFIWNGHHEMKGLLIDHEVKALSISITFEISELLFISSHNYRNAYL